MSKDEKIALFFVLYNLAWFIRTDSDTIQVLSSLLAIASGVWFALAGQHLTQRALDSATPCPDCGSKKLGIHSIKCSRYRPPSK